MCLETSGLLLLDPFEKRKFSIQMCIHSRRARDSLLGNAPLPQGLSQDAPGIQLWLDLAQVCLVAPLMPAVQASVWHVQDGLPGSSLGSSTQELCCPACPSLVAVADFSSCSFPLSIYLCTFPSEITAVRLGLCFDG